ncbi:MAG: hypothetical protein GF350_13145 [Chitinivibrionales bacterium]|nr:hypothetical protein [Chitinivibrionales bacterium]
MVSIAERKLIIRLRKQQKTVSEISEITGFKRSTVGFWVKRHKDNNSFQNMPKSGRPSSFSDETLNKIKSRIIRKVVSKNEEYSSCNTQQLKDIICSEIKKKITIRHARRVLHRIGFSLITPRDKHIKNDPVVVEKYREDFKKNFNRSFWIIQ